MHTLDTVLLCQGINALTAMLLAGILQDKNIAGAVAYLSRSAVLSLMRIIARVSLTIDLGRKNSNGVNYGNYTCSTLDP